MKIIPPSQELLKKMWSQFNNKPGGKYLFSKILSKLIPYTGSISPQILELSNGKSKVQMKDSHQVRNHLSCVHAIALANLGELSTGIAVTSLLPEGTRMILGSLKIDYHKKARGTLTAVAQTEPISIEKLPEDRIVIGKIYDKKGDHVCSVEALWKIALAKKD